MLLKVASWIENVRAEAVRMAQEAANATGNDWCVYMDSPDSFTVEPLGDQRPETCQSFEVMQPQSAATVFPLSTPASEELRLLRDEFLKHGLSHVVPIVCDWLISSSVGIGKPTVKGVRLNATLRSLALGSEIREEMTRRLGREVRL